jgi:hypothetical protein
MARLEGVSDSDAGLMTGQVFKAAKRRIGRVAEPLRIMAHCPPVMYAAGGFELAWDKAKSVDPVLKDLCQLKVSQLVGCVF